MTAMENDHVAQRNIPEVKVVGNGHCHGKKIIDLSCALRGRALMSSHFILFSNGKLPSCERRLVVLRRRGVSSARTYSTCKI